MCLYLSLNERAEMCIRDRNGGADIKKAMILAPSGVLSFFRILVLYLCTEKILCIHIAAISSILNPDVYKRQPYSLPFRLTLCFFLLLTVLPDSLIFRIKYFPPIVHIFSTIAARAEFCVARATWMWNGLLRDLYYKRWEKYWQVLQDQLDGKLPVLLSLIHI